MRKLQRKASLGGVTLPRWIRSQPNYHSEIEGDYLDALQKKIDSHKVEGFRLEPVGEAGW